MGLQEAVPRLVSKETRQRPTSQLVALIKFFRYLTFLFSTCYLSSFILLSVDKEGPRCLVPFFLVLIKKPSNLVFFCNLWDFFSPLWQWSCRSLSSIFGCHPYERPNAEIAILSNNPHRKFTTYTKGKIIFLHLHRVTQFFFLWFSNGEASIFAGFCNSLVALLRLLYRVSKHFPRIE